MSLLERARAARALWWGAVDQGLSSLSNLLISLAVARGSGLEGIGRFAVATAVYFVVLGLQRALVSDPLLVSRRPCPRGGAEERASLSCSLALGFGAGVLTLAAGAATGYPELVALAACLPLMALQDGLRFVALRRLEPRAGVLVDLAWVGPAALAWPLARAGSPARAVVLWGLGAGVSALAGLAILRVRPAGLRNALDWWGAEGGRFALALGGDAALASTATQASLMVIAGVMGPRPLGAVRAAQIIVAPAIILLAAFGAFALPRLARRPRELQRTDGIRASVAAVVLVSPAVALASFKSDALGRLLFGPGTPVHRPIVAGLLVGTVVAAAAQGVVLLLKVSRRSQVLLWARVVAATTLLGLVTMLAASGSTDWMGWAFAGQSTAYLATASAILITSRSTDQGDEPLDEVPFGVPGLEDFANRSAGEVAPRP